MGDSYRLRTQVGINQTIDVQLDQEFEFLEILSLKIQQSDIYTRSCSDYGVIVGRVLANNGFGIPNAKVSIFIPILPVDESNPIISSLYPYKSPEDKNEDGYRYNLLPYEKSYSTHAATGTFPSRNDSVSDSTVVEIYDKYYKFTCKTNSSGDYMIMGVPTGAQTVVMDLDLSDIGEFSLTPQDLIRMGLATESQVDGNRFRSSTDLISLPQIINITKNVEISPLWGDPNICQIAINRVDFDLRDELNIDIQPTSVFIGSIFSSSVNNRVKTNSTISSKLGNLCNLETGPGQIIAIRQTIQQDQDGNPILEVYDVGNSGNVIDGDGTWMLELPMNLDYITTNEFGERVISSDGSVGIPTKGKYRFKIKWKQPTDNSLQKRRAIFLVPNVKEGGWNTSGNVDPMFLPSNSNDSKLLKSSYYFGLDWSGYTEGLSSSIKNQVLNDIINCEDRFYEFNFNKVYTISGLIDQYKRGGSAKFIGIKEINNDECSSDINKFPVNEAFPNLTFSYILFTLALNIVTYILNIIVTSIHLIILPIGSILDFFGVKIKLPGFSLPMLTYPDCDYCKCDEIDIESPPTTTPDEEVPGVLTQFSVSEFYVDLLKQYLSQEQGIVGDSNLNLYSEIISEVLAANSQTGFLKNVPKSKEVYFGEEGASRFAYSTDLPLAERINIFNSRKSYFDELTKIKVTFADDVNSGVSHFDNCLVIVTDVPLTPGQMLSVNDPLRTLDNNFLAQTIGIIYDQDGNPIGEYPTDGQRTSGTTVFNGQITVSYADTQTTSQSVTYSLSNGPNFTEVSYPADIEYFQVIYSNTVSEVKTFWNENTGIQTFPKVFTSSVNVIIDKSPQGEDNYTFDRQISLQTYKYFQDIDNKYITVLQRGVDPYSPKYNNKYSLGNLFGLGVDDVVVNVSARLNIPIQPLPNIDLSVQEPSQDGMMYPSYFFQPQPFDPNTQTGYQSFFTTPPFKYGRIDARYVNNGMDNQFLNGVWSKVTKQNNVFYQISQTAVKYDSAEDLSGVGFLYGNFAIPEEYQPHIYDYINMTYYSPIFPGQFEITNPNKIVLRTDRLPASDVTFTNNTTYRLLQQNNLFRMFLFPNEVGGEVVAVFPGLQPPNNLDPVDVEGLPGASNLLQTFSCPNMVDLNCYEGYGTDFRIEPGCSENDSVVNGCYTFLKTVGTVEAMGKDVLAITEWNYRLNIFYAICNGIISESFTNNWVNGCLYMFPVQVNTYFDLQNKPFYRYPRAVTYFDETTNNLYYRSSPYSYSTDSFVGRDSQNVTGNINQRNLMFPTTIVDLGYKSTIYSEIVLSPESNSYLIDKLESTSYGDNSDIINLFVISRITDANILKQLVTGAATVLFFFNRNGTLNFRNQRIDGDAAQMFSINSEIGNIDFTSDFYSYDPLSNNNPVILAGSGSNPVIGIWFSSTTEDMQTKDYLTPGRINFTATNGQVFPTSFGIKSQEVPFYKWNLNTTNIIFGNQKNNWLTNTTGISSKPYQSLDRTVVGEYFVSSVLGNANYYGKRGYIFSQDSQGNYSLNGANGRDKFLVGAPYHFYFGIKKGFSAFDKFSAKYLPSEEL